MAPGTILKIISLKRRANRDWFYPEQKKHSDFFRRNTHLRDGTEYVSNFINNTSDMTIPINSAIIAALLQLSSPAFKNNHFIPQKYSCQGQNISPALEIRKIPDGTKTLAVILFDPDASSGGFVHWVLWNLPPSAKIEEQTPAGSKGNNGSGEVGYTGPCPPSGTHHYQFTVYALDTKLDLPETSGKKELEAAMQGHILAQGTITGLYKKIR